MTKHTLRAYQRGLKEHRNARVHKSRLKTLEKDGLE